jgi:hypothetical protein
MKEAHLYQEGGGMAIVKKVFREFSNSVVKTFFKKGKPRNVSNVSMPVNKGEPIYQERIPSQAYIIEQLIVSCKYKSYLELGIYFGTTYMHLRKFVEIAHAVDIEGKDFVDKDSFFHQTTDAFFASNINHYDIIFIDASHEFQQVKKDFENSMKVLNKNGIVVLHDTDPYSREYLLPNRCADCYKMNEWLSSQNRYQFITIPMDETGLSLVKRKEDLRHTQFI